MLVWALCFGWLLVVLAGANRAQAESFGWQMQGLPAGLEQSELASVSCTARGGCIAVGFGFRGSGSNELPVALRWDGGAWTMLSVPLPAGSVEAHFNSVSCVTASSCIAVGGSSAGDGERPFAERWYGSKWSISSAPDPKDALVNLNISGAELAAVSCPTARTCVAVSGYVNVREKLVPLVEVWTHRRWRITPKLNPSSRPSAYGGELDAISCASAGGCTAAGYVELKTSGDHSRAIPLIEQLRDGRWTLQRTPNPRPHRDAFLDGISCPRDTACTAVGADDIQANTLAIGWNGLVWSIEPSVSCPSTSHCGAVGYRSTSTGFLALTERFAHERWRTQQTARPATAVDSYLNAVSCSRINACAAVGTSAPPTFRFILSRSAIGKAGHSLANRQHAKSIAAGRCSYFAFRIDAF
jgi:hypothetical protein